MSDSDILKDIHTPLGQEYREVFCVEIPGITPLKVNIAILVAHGQQGSRISKVLNVSSKRLDDLRSEIRTAIGLERNEDLQAALLKLVHKHRESKNH
jgi:hypothetical protein